MRSAQRESSAEAKQAPRSKDGGRAGHLAFVAHEMRNPLSTALWSAELLARLSPEERGGPRGEKLAGMCLRTLARLRHLVEDHFLADRLAVHGIPVRIEGIPLAEALTAAAGRVAGARYEAAVDGFVVHADRAMLERALEALVAVAGRDGTAVQVAAERGQGVVRIQVRGAPPGEDPFRLPDRSTPSDPTGRALGLLAAQSVAAVHGGTLEVCDGGYLLSLPVDPSGEER